MARRERTTGLPRARGPKPAKAAPRFGEREQRLTALGLIGLLIVVLLGMFGWRYYDDHFRLPHKTVLSVANDDLALRPGMTATARIVTANRENALLVPNAALRFSPPTTSAAKSSGSILSRLLPRPPQPRKQQQAQAVSAPGAARQVWVLRDGQPAAVSVQTGVSNGRYTEVLGGALQPGMAVITEYQEARK